MSAGPTGRFRRLRRLLLGSALGARIGSAATAVVDSDRIKFYVGGMLLAGAVAVAIGEVGSLLGSDLLEPAGLVVVIGAAVIVASAIIDTTVVSLRATRRRQSTTAD